jgi:hypothetical protein
MSFVGIFQQINKQRIKKVKVKKSYFDPAAGVPPKRKYDDKRIYNIEGEPLNVVIMHQHQGNTYPAAKLVIDFRRLMIMMRASAVRQISTVFDLKLLNRSQNFNFLQILGARNMVLIY